MSHINVLYTEQKERRVIATASKFIQAFLHADDSKLNEDDDDPFLELHESYMSTPDIPHLSLNDK